MFLTIPQHFLLSNCFCLVKKNLEKAMKNTNISVSIYNINLTFMSFIFITILGRLSPPDGEWLPSLMGISNARGRVKLQPIINVKSVKNINKKVHKRNCTGYESMISKLLFLYGFKCVRNTELL